MKAMDAQTSPLEKVHQARDEYDQFMKSFPSKTAVKAFLFDRANAFLREKSLKHKKTGEILVSRKERRKAAREISKRLSTQAVGGAL